MPRNRFTEREREEDLDAERQVVEAEVERAPCSGRRAPGPPTRTTAIRRKFVIGPARLTNSMLRRGLRIRFGFTGTGLAHASTGNAEQGAHRRHDDRADRVDVRDRVEGEAAGTLGGVVTEPRRDDPVADLVQDHGDQQAAEEDDRLLEVGVHEARRAQRRCEAQLMHSRAAGIASRRASGMRSWQFSHSP